MNSCEKTTRLISEGMDHHLPWFKRMAVRMHLLMCRYCAAYYRQLTGIRALLAKARQAGRQIPAEAGPDLSDAARRRIKEALRRRP